MLQSLLLISLGHYHGHFIEFQRCSDRYISYVQLWPLFFGMGWIRIQNHLQKWSTSQNDKNMIYESPISNPVVACKNPASQEHICPQLSNNCVANIYIYYGNLWDHSIHAVVAKLGANELDDLMQIFANLKEALCFLGGWQIGRLKSQSNHPWIVFGNPIYI